MYCLSLCICFFGGFWVDFDGEDGCWVFVELVVLFLFSMFWIFWVGGLLDF